MRTVSATFPVRYAETDQMGVVYHANYLVWCEIGRTTLINDLGFSYKDMEDAGVVSPVTNINLSYKYPAKYGDDVTVHAWIESYTGARVTYGYTIENADGKRLSEGTSEHVCCDDQTFRPISLKKRFPEWDKAYKEHRRQE